MKEKWPNCCANCKHLWKMEDWTDYPNGQYFRDVCGAFAKDKSIMALYGDITSRTAFCECYVDVREERK